MQHDVVPPIERFRPRVCIVDSGLVRSMMLRCQSQTPSSLNDQFGISWNSWAKLRKGQPIRRSLALRLVSRVLADEGQHAGPLLFFERRGGCIVIETAIASSRLTSLGALGRP